LTECRKKLKQKFRGVLVEFQEYPGDVTRPDDEKIKAIGFNAPLPTAPVAAVVK